MFLKQDFNSLEIYLPDSKLKVKKTYFLIHYFG